jgi:RNA polymerase sigma-B factor
LAAAEIESNNFQPNCNSNKIEENLAFLKEVVQEFQNSGEPEEELMQVGYIGLLNAVNLYQEHQQDTFQQYAGNLIRGEIRNHIREKNKKVDIPDWLSVIINKLLNQMLTAYRKQYNKFPSLAELSQMLELSPEILKEALKARKAAVEVSIDQHRRSTIDLQEPLDIVKIRKEINKR